MKWRFFAVLLIAAFAYADISLNANITALKLDKNSLFIGTDAGEVLWYDLAQKKLNEHFFIKLPSVQNYYEKDISARIHSLDEYGNSFLLVSEGDFGTQNISICRNFKIKAKDNTACATIKSPFTNIKKAFFIDKDTALIALLSSEIKLVDLKGFANVNAKKERKLSVLKEYKFSHTSLNDIVLNDDKVLAATESGELQVFDLKTWKLLANYDKINKDTLDQIDFKNGVVLSCGKERKIGIVRNNEQKFELMPFLTYSCALSPSGQIAAYSMLKADNRNSNTTLVRTGDFKEIKIYENSEFFAKFIVFTNENEFIAAGGNTILFRSVQ